MIARLKSKLGSGSTLGSISVLASGAVLAQLVVLLASPLLTRLYTPEEFGFLAIFAGVLNVILVVASLRYQVAIPLAEGERAGTATVILCLLTCLVVALLLMLLVIYFGDAFAELVNVAEHRNWLYLLPFAVLLAGWFETFRFWNVRTRQFAPLAGARLQQSIAMTLVQVGFFRFGVAALLLGQVIGRFSGLLRLARPFGVALKRNAGSITPAELSHQAREFRRFPLYSTWGALISAAGRQLPTVFFAALAGPAVAGLYALSHRILASPLSLVSDAISSVFTSRVVPDAGLGSDLPTVVRSFYAALCLLGAIPALALMIAGEAVFGVIFGAEWSVSGLYAALMSPWILLVFVSTPMMVIFSVMSRDAELTYFQLALAVARVAALFAGWTIGDAAWALALFSLVSSIAYVAMLARVYVLAGMTIECMFRPLLGALGAALLVTSPLLLQRFQPGVSPLAVWSVFVLFAIGFYAWLGREILRRAGALDIGPSS